MKKPMPSTKNGKDTIAYLLLIIFAAILILIIKKDGFLYGSRVDWISQHSVIPDYFRQKFYETGNLFPDFAMNLGGGQNIYNFSYYGLLSPIVLFSYLLPWVSMTAYISATSIIIVISSGCLCYKWLTANEIPRKIAFTAAICFICAGPLIFQSHRQIMFVDYFPFLFLGLFGVDQYRRIHKKGMFILGAFCCIMTSYFFSVGCILTLLIYAAFVNLKSRPDSSLRELSKGLIPFIKGIAIAVFMAGVLWLPTLYVVVNGRGGGSVSWLSLIIPTLPFKALMQGEYSLGLTAISLIALISALLGKKRNEKIIALILTLFLISPLFLYLLNGTIYIREKALIPLLPLYILVTAVFLRKVEKTVNRFEIKKFCRKGILVVGLLLLVISYATLNCLLVNAKDELVKVDEYMNYNNPEKLSLIQKVLKNDSSFFRINEIADGNVTSNYVYGAHYNQTSIYSSTYNKDYNVFFYDVMNNPFVARNRVISVSSKNIFFQNFMNVKYVIAKGNATAGYKLIDQKGEYKLYENQNTMPLGFATSRTISQKNFDQISFPQGMGAVFENIIVSKEIKAVNAEMSPSGFDFKRIDLKENMPLIENQKNVLIQNEEGHFNIKAKQGASIEIPLDINLRDTVLVVKFKVSDKENQEDVDTSVTINGLKNKLSSRLAAYPNGNREFVYILSSNKKSDRLTVEFSPGKYEISDLEAYVLSAAAVGEAIKKKDPFLVDMKNTGENQITGDIKVRENGYFAITIPFDKGFDVIVDGKKQNYEKVNTAFIGFPIDKGEHHIEIRYNSPYKRAGMAVSVIGFIMFALSCISDRKYRINSRKL
ncbi:YfhO family protein [Parasporobacterium paucivorans]|uniref:Uncharacterized membrane protein YfhO n=1 Tax=Parasporobacterium paucivorans DSM 15970 TaxID=1122934 RepID=A0A1M6D171_9FIRM|nr:YfhO family protein [Parasporobacterium paucivorans]SHI66863.1 Uncharacterized membrane protein YfhO [Parasporobacterium paucivorans DSM 15970]